MKHLAHVSSLGEFGLIDVIKKYCPTNSKVIQSIGDDTAVLAFDKATYQLFTTDMMVEDVHFTRLMPAKLVGHKALACNISDIAAMGGLPTFAVVSLGLPSKTPIRWVKDFYTGLGKVANSFNVAIVGGDTVKADKIVVNIALLGLVEKKNLVTRSNAKPGDYVMVTGLLGGSLKSGRHLSFTPKVNQAQFLVKNFKPSAMMDISDGLAGDLNHLLRLSKVGAVLYNEHIPCHKNCSLKQALTDGEDYELLFTLTPYNAKRLLDWQINNKCHYFYHVGEIVANKKSIIKLEGFKHF